MISLGTKAETLKKLYQKLKVARILPQFIFTVGEWKAQREVLLEKFEEIEWNKSVIVRSSAINEDTSSSSCAGKYESIANVCGIEAFLEAVNEVIDSYDDDDPDNQVLVQPMLENVQLCGVAFTLEPSTLGNYYVVNYDKTGSTDAITSGNGKRNYLQYIFKDYDSEKYPKELATLLETLKELEILFGSDNLDVEFAITSEWELYILQVRPLCVAERRIDVVKQKQQLDQIAKKIKRDQTPKPFVCGEKTVYSVMTDWNPAEMIGVRPKTLALTLYQDIITDAVWAYQRDNYGYRNMRSFPLMVDLGGLPYIDVRVSFNSFVPAELEEEISEKLVNYYLQSLIENPEKHDKAEFDIVFSCYTLDLPERIKILYKYGFTEEEINKIIISLRNVTNNIIDHKNGLWRKDYEKIKILESRYDQIMDSDMNDIEKIYWLLEDCKRYGTLPFAGLARAGFIAVQLLQSMVACNVFTQADYEAFMNGLNSVSSSMNEDFAGLSQNAFLKKYGHLRPGTYDIMSARYDEEPETYFDWNSISISEIPEKDIFRLSLQQLNRLKEKLDENGLTNNILELMDFIKNAIEGREYGKFAFTKNLSKALQLLSEIGEREGISREECAYINVRVVRDLYASTKDIKVYLKESINRGKEEYKMVQGICLPPFLSSPDEVFSFIYPDSEPNYITSGKIVANVSCLDNISEEIDISDKIVLIPSADPGYDWIFSHGIKGFITMYGGANSHMAIRAGELGIPAAVGVGGKLFSQYQEAKVIEIDALNKMIKILK